MLVLSLDRHGHTLRVEELNLFKVCLSRSRGLDGAQVDSDDSVVRSPAMHNTTGMCQCQDGGPRACSSEPGPPNALAAIGWVSPAGLQ